MRAQCSVFSHTSSTSTHKFKYLVQAFAILARPYSVFACVHVCFCTSEADRKGRRGRAEAYPEGSKPKPQDIFDLLGQVGKATTERREREEGREREKKTQRRSEGKREQRDGKERSREFERQLESLQNPLLKPTIKFQPKLRGQYKLWTRVPPWPQRMCASQHTFVRMCAQSVQRVCARSS